MNKTIAFIALLFFVGVLSRTDSGCPAGYYLKNNNQCVALAANCKVGTTALAKDCTECVAGFAKINDDIGCQANLMQCKAPCDIESTIICNGCADGYYPVLNVNKTAIGLCTACTIANCKTCSDVTTCTSCNAGFYYDTTAKTCKACIDGCSVCSDSASCTTCKNGFAKLSTGKCGACGADTATCNPDKTSESLTCNAAVAASTGVTAVTAAFLNTTTKTCKQIAGCEEGAEDKCTKCLDGFRLKSDGTCIACSGANVWLCNSTSDTAESIISCKVGFVKTVAGTTVTTVACQAVIDGCTEQNSDAKCTKCEATRVLHNGACPVCATQFAGCSTCSDGSITTEGKCTGCNTTGFYNSGSATAVTCTACPTNCQTCSASGCTACNANAFNTATAPAVSCTLCDANATGCTDALNVSGCKAAYVSGAIDFCRACKDAQCTACATYDVCSACNAGHSVVSGACAKCDANCTKTTPSCATNGAGKCDADNQCDNANGYYLTLAATDSAKANTCQKCDANCKVATNCVARGGACADGGCKDGFGTDATTKTCKACSTTNCVACSAAFGTCTKCASGFGLKTADKTCVACVAASGCDQCDHADPSTADCTACVVGKMIDGSTPKKCISGVTNCKTHKTGDATKCNTCADGFNGDTATADAIVTCAACTAASNCLTCPAATKPSECATCATGRGLQTAATKTCVLCSSNCSDCTGADTDGKCIKTKCSIGFGMYAAATLTAGCTACPSKCGVCDTAASKCDTCLTGLNYFLKQDKSDCNTCQVANCDVCEDGDNASALKGYDRCKTCKAGFLLNAAQTSCDACGNGCNVCTSSTVCTTCKDGFWKDANNACQACGSNCKTCSAAGGCDSCIEKYLFDAVAKACNACAANCKDCTVKATCDGGTCTGAWGKTSGVTKTQTLCFACPTSCATCTVDNKQVTTCTKCNANYYLDASKTCTIAGNDKCYAADGTNCTKCKYGFKLTSGSAGCADCVGDKTCPASCSASTTTTGTTGTGGNASNTTTATDTGSAAKIAFNLFILVIVSLLGHMMI